MMGIHRQRSSRDEGRWSIEMLLLAVGLSLLFTVGPALMTNPGLFGLPNAGSSSAPVAATPPNLAFVIWPGPHKPYYGQVVKMTSSGSLRYNDRPATDYKVTDGQDATGHQFVRLSIGPGQRLTGVRICTTSGDCHTSTAVSPRSLGGQIYQVAITGYTIFFITDGSPRTTGIDATDRWSQIKRLSTSK